MLNPKIDNTNVNTGIIQNRHRPRDANIVPLIPKIKRKKEATPVQMCNCFSLQINLSIIPALLA